MERRHKWIFRYYDFFAAADAGSFSAASQSLNYAQYNLSSRIRNLEDELGTRLFYRNRKGVVLTSKGKILYEYAVRLASLSEEAQKAVKDQGTAKGPLAVGSLESIVLEDLPAVLSDYHSHYPEVQLSLQTDMNDSLINSVLNHSLDGAFIADATEHPELNRIPFCKNELILVGSAEDTDSSALEILKNKSLITFPVGSVFRRHLELLLAYYKIPYQSRLQVMNSLSSNIVNICSLLGCGYLTRGAAAPYIRQGIMREYPIQDPHSELEISFIYRKDHFMDTTFRCFIDTIQSSVNPA